MIVQLHNTKVKLFIRAVYPKAQKLKRLTDNPSYQFAVLMNAQNRADEFAFNNPCLQRHNSYVPIQILSMRPVFNNSPESEQEELLVDDSLELEDEKLPKETLVEVKGKLKKQNDETMSRFNVSIAKARKEFNNAIKPKEKMLRLIDGFAHRNPTELALPFLTTTELKKLADIFTVLSTESIDNAKSDNETRTCTSSFWSTYNARIHLASMTGDKYEVHIDDKWSKRFNESAMILQGLARNMVVDLEGNLILDLEEHNE